MNRRSGRATEESGARCANLERNFSARACSADGHGVMADYRSSSQASGRRVGMVWARPRLNSIWAGWPGYAAALGAVALVSILIGLVLGRMPVANVSMLYLIAVLAVAVA